MRHETTPVRLIDSIIDEEDQILLSTYVNTLEKDDNADADADESTQLEENGEPAPKITIEDPFAPIQTSEIESSMASEQLPEKITIKKKPGRKKKEITTETKTKKSKTDAK